MSLFWRGSTVPFTFFYELGGAVTDENFDSHSFKTPGINGSQEFIQHYNIQQSTAGECPNSEQDDVPACSNWTGKIVMPPCQQWRTCQQIRASCDRSLYKNNAEEFPKPVIYFGKGILFISRLFSGF
jgi:hypothetical protein